MLVLFDIGGTHTRVGKSLDKTTIKDLKIFPTPKDFQEGIQAIKQATEELAQGAEIEAAAGGMPGRLNKDKSQVTNSVNMAGWVNQPLKQKLLEVFSSPVFLENDANLGTLGEATFGAGKEKDIVAFLTVSTGLGGGRVVNGRIDSNSLGFEPGKHIVDITKTPPAILEDFISGVALERRFGKKSEDIEDEEVWDEEARNLAVGINNVLVFWSPDIVVLGGSVMKSIDIEKVRNYTKETVRVFSELPPIEKGILGDEVGLWGALAYLNQKST